MESVQAAAVRLFPGDVVRRRLADVVSQLATAAALIVICVYLTFASPYFLTSTNLANVSCRPRSRR